MGYGDGTRKGRERLFKALGHLRPILIGGIISHTTAPRHRGIIKAAASTAAEIKDNTPLNDGTYIADLIPLVDAVRARGWNINEILLYLLDKDPVEKEMVS